MAKNLPASAGDIRDSGLIPGSGRSPGGGNGNPLQLFLPGESDGQKSLAGYSPMGLIALPHVGSSQTRDGTHVSSH